MSLRDSPAPAWQRGMRRWLCLIGLLGLIVAQPALAHLMVAQRGTLNIVDSGGFVVMALPVSAFHGVDDDGDGLMSMAEMRAHAGAIEAQVLQGLKLIGDDGPRRLEALMLNLSPDDSTPAAPVRHLVVLGRFALAEGDFVAGSTAANLRLRLTLFGKTSDLQQQSITITRGADKQLMVLAPGREARAVLPSAWKVMFDNLVLGAEHIVAGADHLLFLLLVLASGWGLRQVILGLSAFTVGHAITLTLSVLGGFEVPAAIVEPAIAATIIGMAAFDLRARRRRKPMPTSWRLALVFGCALIHGLALGNALTDAGLDGRNRWASLIGFNLGIELAQIIIALAAAGLVAVLRRLPAAAALPQAARVSSVFAIGAGGVWLVQRLVQGV